MKTNIKKAIMDHKDDTKIIMNIADACNVKQVLDDVIPLVDSTLVNIGEIKQHNKIHGRSR